MNRDEALFYEVIERGTSDAAAAYLDQACAGDDGLRQRVERLLAAHGGRDSLLDEPANVAVATCDMSPAISERAGHQIGPYKLIQQIGEGGMGVVYMAQQTEPVKRLVALKIIKPGMDSRQVIARFEAERQALALMDHPNIAKVLDAGTTESGLPYFVMELVKGIPITTYCDEKRLTPRERLELFIPVCHAVQHAHQKGIIHRDLKPTNVLIALYDGLPVPKVIDFGVAKATGGQLTDKTLVTNFGSLVGTLEYMSPEQAELNQLDVDTRSDIYALGVLLYELLTGDTPFDRQRLRTAAFDEMLRIIREEEPETVSARIARTQSRVGSAHHASASTPRSEFRASRFSELDWIVARALEKDRSRRYETAGSLAADIQRYLHDEPVHACPPSTMYRFQKFAKKHKPATAAAAAIAACLLLGTTVSAWQAVRATAAEAQANANEQKANASAAQAQENAQEAKEKAQEATTQRDEAQRQRDEVQRQRDEVKALSEKLLTSQQNLQRTLYAAHMNLAQNAWDASNVGRVTGLLNQHLTKPDDPDLRGFEWHYLHRLCNAEILNLKTSGHSVAYSPDGKRLVNAEADKVKVWNAQTGQLLLTLKGGSVAGNWSNCVAFSPDGKRLAGPAERGTAEVKVWDAETGQELVTFKGHTSGGIGTLAFNPDGKRVASGRPAQIASPDGQRRSGSEVKVWDSQTGMELFSISEPNYWVGSVAFSPDGKQLAGGSKVLDAQSGKELFDLKGTGNTRVAYSPDGKRLASTLGDMEKKVTVSDAQTGQELLSLLGHSAAIDCVAFSPDGKYLASGSRDRTMKIWDAQTGQELFTIKGTGWVTGVAFSPDSKRIVSNGNTVKVWNVQPDQHPLTLKGNDDSVASVSFSPDGKRLASGGGGDSSKPWQVNVWDTQTGKVLLTLKDEDVGGLGSVTFSPDGKCLATDSTKLKVWDAETGQQLLSIEHDVHDGRGNDSLAFSPDGKRLASCSGMGRGKGPGYVKVWDAQTGQELLQVKDTNHVNSVTFSPDGKRLAGGTGLSATGEGEVKVWDAQTGQELLSINGLTSGSGVHHTVFSPNGQRLAGRSGGSVMVWDTQTGKELLKLPTGSWGLAFSPDGKRLVSAGYDKTVKLWDAQTGEELLTVEGHSGFYNGVAFSPDGHRLACGADGGTVKIYDATPVANP